MKMKWKRMMAGLLAMLMMLGSVFSGGYESKAASPSSNLRLWYASTKEHGVVTEFNSYTYTGNIMYAMLDGNVAYCLNYAKSADGSQSMTSSSTPKTALSAAQEKQLAYCMYYGYGNTTVAAPNNTQRNEFIATQAMVWIIEKNLFGTPQADSAAQKLCACAPSSAESYAYYETLRNKMLASYNVVIPSFASTTQSGAPTYELKWNSTNQRFETTLNDTNGALSNFNFSLSGYSMSKNGNQLTIYTSNVNTTPTVASATEGTGLVEPKSSCVYWQINKDKYQEFVSTRPQVDPVSAYIRVKTESIGYGKVTKSDDKSGITLSGAKYGIFSDSGCTRQVATMTTGADGTATSEGLVAGTYYVKEIQAPKGYVLSDKVHTVLIQAGQTTSFSATNKEQMGAITIYKEGEVLTDWNGSNFVYEMKRLQGASFRVTAGADIYKSDGTKVHSKGDVIAEKLTTGLDGKVLLTDLHLGTYVVTEIESIPGYTINENPQTVEVLYKDQTVDVQYEATTIRNARQKAEVSVMKKDSDTDNPLLGGAYTMYANNDIVNDAGEIIVSKGGTLQTVETDHNGKATYTLDLPIENGFYVKETRAPEGYVRDSEAVYEFHFNYLEETKASVSFTKTFVNDRTTAKIKLQKVDADTNTAIPQGDASLKGAEYGIYARTDIVHPDRATGVIFKAGDLVATVRTDKYGKAEVSNLYLGNYYVKEISASEGYNLDETEHDVVCNYEGDLVAVVSRSTVSKELIKSQPFQLIKVSDNGMETEAPLLEGAGFTAYLKSAIPLKEDGSYNFKKATPVVLGTNGETEVFTDEKGYLLTRNLPYGTYVVVESTTPHNMKTIKPFEVRITEHKPTQPQVWRVFLDREFTAKLRIVKMDADTGKTVLQPNAEFKIYDMDKEEYVSMITTYPSKVTHTSFFTDADGDLILPNVLAVGNYRVEEVKAPFGYVMNEKYIEIAVDSNTFYEIDPDTNDAIITVEYENVPAIGELIVEKRGEVLVDFKGTLFSPSHEKEFVYEERGLEGAVFEVYAAEDIYTADMQLNADGERTKYYAKGDLVATLVTDEDGKAVLSNLPLGKYKVVETQAPDGYVLNKKEQVVSFVYVDDKTPVIQSKATMKNDRQKVEIRILKKDADTQKVLEGAEFGLYAESDIFNADGELIVKKGTLIEKAMSDENGIVLFKKDYPFGKYMVQELKAPEGYQLSEEKIIFEASYKGQHETKSTCSAEVTNEALPVPEIPEAPKTGDTGDVRLWFGIGVVGLISIILLVSKKKGKK